MIWIMGALSFAGGILNSVQSGCNASLNKGLGQPLFAALIIAASNCLLYLAFAPFLGLQIPDAKSFAQVPWWAWLGGVCGALNILTTIFFADRLGGGVFIGLVVTAGLIASVVIDNYGLFGYARHPAGLWRIVGCLTMLGGLALVAAF